jgi:hypothetical protein
MHDSARPFRSGMSRRPRRTRARLVRPATYAFTRQPDGTTVIDEVIIREGKNLKGRLLAIVLGTIGKGVLVKAFRNTVKAIEARNAGVQAA